MSVRRLPVASSWRAALFALSVALNVFLAALVLTHVLRPAPAPAGYARVDGPIGRILDSLPPAEAHRMRAVLDRAQPQRLAARDRVAGAQRDVASAIARVPYDEGEVRRALLAWQSAWRDFSTDFNDGLIEALGSLSDDGRARFAAAALAEDARHRRAP